MHNFFIYRRLLLIFLTAQLSTLFGQDTGPKGIPSLSFEDALLRVTANDPELRRLDANVAQAEGQVVQADLRPNPVVGAELENILGTGPFEGVKSAEITLGMSQLIETAGKRAKRTALARTERERVLWQRDLRLAEIESEVHFAFVEILMMQEMIDLRRQQLSLAERSEKETKRHVEAARTSQVDLSRAQLAVRRQEVAIQQAERSLVAAKSHLAGLWGDPNSAAFEVTGSVHVEAQLPSLPVLLTVFSQTLTMQEYDLITRTHQAELELEQAYAKSDFEIFGGARYFNEEAGDVAFMVGIEVPLPLFDKNQGNVLSAQARLNAVAFEAEARQREWRSTLTESYQALGAAHADIKSLQQDLRPSAEQVLAETEAGYERGQFNLLSVLESRATLFEIREAYLDALHRYATAQARIETLTRTTPLK
ncbi:TolC family protein [Kiritimatiellota bacterium B12222]|nr:TolC family protein [Kiritimatiellota bacterium B12222]